MALNKNNVLTESWEGYSRGEIEDALKERILQIEHDLESETADLGDIQGQIYTITSRLNSLPSWSQSSAKPNYNANEIGGIDNFANLLAKLQDMDQKIQAAQGGGIDPDDYYDKYTVDGKLAGKVDKTDYTDTDKNKLRSLPANPVTSISVNGGTPQTPTQGNVNIEVTGAAGDDGVTPHIGANGNWWVGPETDSSNDTGVHAQGPAGTSFTDADLEIANVLDGTGDVLGVGGAMMIKNNMNVLAASLNRLYNKLANMAFWDSQDQEDAEPTELDWSIPKHQLTVTNNNANAKVYRNGTEVTGSLSIEENATVELVVAPVGDYVVSGVTPSTGTATDLGDGTFKVVLTMGNTDIALTLTVTTTATYAITVNGSHVTASGATRIVAGGTATVNLAADNGFELPSAASGLTISGATISSYTPSQDLTTAVLVIGSATGAVTIGVTVGAGWLTVPHDDVSENGAVVTYGMQQGRSIWGESDYRGGQTTDGVANGAPAVALMPAGVPADVKLATAALNPNTTSPGNTQAFFFATGGKRYLNVILTGVDTTYDYALAVACYYDSVIGAASFSKSMFVRRINYATYNTETVNVWKFDLFTAATGVSASEGDIKYIKFLFVKRTSGTTTGLDSRTWLNNAVIKFKMTDD